MPKTIHIFSDYACPWCYLGLARLQQAIEGKDVDVVLLPFPLSPDNPTEGRAVKPYLEARGMDYDAARARLVPLLEAEGLAWNDGQETFAYNTSRAQELAVWAMHHAPDRVAALHTVLFRVFQVDNRNVHHLDVLRDVAEEVGLDADAAIQAVADGTHRDEVQGWWARARQMGVRGVPTFISNGKGVTGAQSVAVLSDFVRNA